MMSSRTLHCVWLCLQEPEGTSGHSSGQHAAWQQKMPAAPADSHCGPGAHAPPAPDTPCKTDMSQNPDPGSLPSQGPGLMAPPSPTPHPPPQAPPTKSDCHSFLPPPPSPHSHPDSSSTSSSSLISFPPPPAPPPKEPPLVDVRMIDFAHSTFKGFRGDTAVHDGPDRGYVFGLESLVRILESLRDDNLP